MDQSEYPTLRSSLERLILNDSSVSVHPDSSSALGQGWSFWVYYIWKCSHRD